MGAVTEGTKTRLLVEARDLYLEVGFAKFSLREVARRVGISAPAIYRHFASKEALLKEVCSAGFRQFGSYLLQALGERSPEARLSRSAELYFQFAMENPRDYRVIFMGAAEDFTPKRDPKAAPDPTFQFLVDRVEECMRARILEKGDATEVAAMIWAHVHGLVSLRLSGHFSRAGADAQFAKFYRHAVNRLLSGLAA